MRINLSRGVSLMTVKAPMVFERAELPPWRSKAFRSRKLCSREKPEAAKHYKGVLQNLTGGSMSSAVASKLGAGCWGEADDESSRAAPLGFLVGWWLRDEIGVFLCCCLWGGLG